LISINSRVALVLKALLTWKLVLSCFWFSNSMGCKRGIYSNEAGPGTAPHIAAAANVSSYQTRFSAIILGLYRYFISVFGY
jgi:AGCS family alanine or glycine:cation symporter